MRFLSPGHLSATTGLWGSWLERVQGPCGWVAATLICGVVPNGSPQRFGSRPKGDRLSRVLDEERFSLEADGPRAVRGRYFLDAKGRQRPVPNLNDHVEPVEGIGDAESGQVESPDSAHTLWGPGDPLDGVFGRVMVWSLVLYAIGDRGRSRNVSFARHLPLQDVGEFTETSAHGASAKHVSVRSSSLDLVPPELENLRAGSKDAHC